MHIAAGIGEHDVMQGAGRCTPSDHQPRTRPTEQTSPMSQVGAPALALPESPVRLFQIPEPFEARIQSFADGSFQLISDGREATLLPVYLDGGREIDTVAFFSGRPRRWFRQLLVATHLGDQALCHAQFLGKPVRLLATPADWLASPEGMVVLDWRCDLRALFGEVPEIVCASTEMQKYLDQSLAKQVAHRYRITVARMGAAA